MGRAVRGALAEVTATRFISGLAFEEMDTGPFNSRQEAREKSPIKPGDVVKVHDPKGKSVRALVVAVHVDVTSFHEYALSFKVRRKKNNGGWSALWEYTYPGFIERAFAGDLAD